MESIREQFVRLGFSEMQNSGTSYKTSKKAKPKKEPKQQTLAGAKEPMPSKFIAENGDEHTRIASSVAEVKIGKRNKKLTLPNGETVIQFAAWVHDKNKKVAINFFGYGKFAEFSTPGHKEVAKVELWEKKTKSGNTFRYINFYPTKDKPRTEIIVGLSSVDDYLVRFK